jgi:hypothetical protein
MENFKNKNKLTKKITKQMAKIDVIREKFKDKIKPVDFIELANNIDNSKTKKYVEHMVRFTKNLSNDFEHTAITEMEYILGFLTKFDELSTNGLIENADLNQYKNLSAIKQSIKDATLIKSIGKAKKEIKILYEDDKCMLFLPLSYDAASVYGRGTKWCVTQSEYFYRYSDKGILAYFIEKEKNRKIGLYYDMNDSYYRTVLKSKTDSGLKQKSMSVIQDDIEDVFGDSGDSYKDYEMREIYNFSTKFSCWTDWDSRMEMMFVPIPHQIKSLFIDYCKEKNIQSASLLDEFEIKHLISYYEDDNLEPMLGMNMGNDEIEMEMEAPQEQAYENNPVVNYEF